MRLALPAFLASAALLSACQPAEAPEVPAEPVVTEGPAVSVEAPPQEEVVQVPIAPSPPAVDTEPGSCLADIGEAASARLVARCIQVSPATRPPCNVANSCEMIQGEIDRSCALFGDDVPAECVA